MTIAKTTFHWNNYWKPTPNNLLRFSQMIQGILAGASGVTSFMGLAHWIPGCIAFSIIIVNQVVQFFGNVVHDLESATATFPSGEEVTVTKEKTDGKETL